MQTGSHFCVDTALGRIATLVLAGPNPNDEFKSTGLAALISVLNGNPLQKDGIKLSLNWLLPLGHSGRRQGKSFAT